MKKILVSTLCMFVCMLSFAQTVETKKAVFHLSFVPPLSTNGLHAAQYTNKASFNLLVGVSKNEDAFTFGGLTNVVLNDAKGFQIAGLSNHVGNDGIGFQLAGLANTNRNSFSGCQFAGVLNTASDMEGAQLGGLFNVARSVNGAQFGGLFNVAGDVKGAQFAGLFNIAKKVNGAQFAILVNVAEDSDCPIGLVNIIKNGEKSIAVTYDGLGSTIVSFRSGGAYTYGILGFGYNHRTIGNEMVTEGGLGAHIPVTSWFRINNEIKATSIGSSASNPVLNGGYSLIPAFRLGQHFEMFAGVGINYMLSTDVNNGKLFPKHSLWKKFNSSKLQQLYIGYQVGVQYIF